MWRVEGEMRRPPHDWEPFLNVVNANGAFFLAGEPVHVARAPGRLDLMGGIADYSGSLVLELPLGDATYAAVQAVPEPTFTVVSILAAPGESDELRVRLPMGELTGGRATGYDEVRERLTKEPEHRWVSYVAGTLVILARERGLRPTGGFRVLVHSTVPLGAGVSSSAALEVATMGALLGALGLELEGREMALLCQRAENLVVGAPCGVMDQMTATLGETGRLLCLLCQPAELKPSLLLPRELEVWGIHSGIKHAVSGSDYRSVRTGAFMGYRVIAELAGLKVSRPVDGRVDIEDPLWGGYLANVSPAEWEGLYRDRMPETLGGAEFLERYGGFTDTVTRVEPARAYAVRTPAAHPIYEHARVRRFRDLLENLVLGGHGVDYRSSAPVTDDQSSSRGASDGDDRSSSIISSPAAQHDITRDDRFEVLGEPMYESHASYSACGLGSGGTDRLVELVREAGARAGLWGAKITGGGSGGTVAVLASRGARDEVERIAAQYGRETGRQARVLGGSSAGAAHFGVVRLVSA